MDSLLTAEALSVLIGVRKRAIYNMVAAGEIPGAMHIGRRLRFNSSAVRSWLRLLRRNGRRRPA
jgi:excisionase family DNA binding protein